jgi:hypothetical protein
MGEERRGGVVDVVVVDIAIDIDIDIDISMASHLMRCDGIDLTWPKQNPLHNNHSTLPLPLFRIHHEMNTLFPPPFNHSYHTPPLQTTIPIPPIHFLLSVYFHRVCVVVYVCFRERSGDEMR